MRACLLLCAALALAPRPRAAAERPPPPPRAPRAPHLEPARLDHIKTQILAKLGLSSRPTPLGAPPRDVVRQILARAADPLPERRPEPEHSMREIIAIAHRDKCSLACKGSPTTPSFLNGHTYNYAVDGAVSVYLSGANGKESTVKLFGQVSVSALGNCALVLNVKNLAITGPDGKKYPCPKGIDKPVQFSLEDGRVGDQICAENGDTRRSLNIKRAIISLLQTDRKSSTQVDFFGSCATDVSSSEEGGEVLIHKSRDLSRCGHREQGKSEFFTAVYNPTAEIKNTQVLHSTINVESKVKGGVPEKITATEEYLYSPFSVGDNGARAKVHTKLTLSGTGQGGGAAGNCVEPRTIIFENPHGVVNEQSNFKNAISAVKETAKTVATEASSKSAGNFAQLVRIFRTTNKDDLIKVFNQVKGNNLEKRVFLDGLFRTGTGFSIEASIQILKSKALNSIEETLVFLSLGNARHVNNEAIKAAAGVLDLPNLPKEVYLGVGALAGAYCRQHDCHESKNDGVVALSKKLAAKLQNCKPKTKVEEDNVIAVLKGIRNIRHLEDSLIDKLVHCAADNNVKARVRVAALEAFQADSCSAKVKKTALDIMKNVQQDSEIRIKAYLAVIDCPCAHSANEVKNLISREPVHQVGHFITSSLRHIKSSSNPDKYLARKHYALIGIPNKFNIDERKYSNYREFSYNVDALGVGGNVEQTVIFSQDSFLPRSASLNLTAEVFGHNINVLEIGGRQGNLDKVIEHFLGPKSFLRTQKPQDIYDDLLKRMEESAQKVEKSVRGRRSIKSEVDNFDKQIKGKVVNYNNELDLDVYLKLFGTDAVFLSLGDDKGFNANNLLDQLLKLLNDGMNKMKRFQQEVRGHILFLDAELAYPTSTGLPLKLDLVGAATARVEVASSINVKECLKSPENAKVDIKLVPSTDIEITGIFIVDADAVATGLKVTTNLHSSTGGHLIAKVIEGGRGFDLQFALPMDKQEVLTASSDVVYFSAEKGCMEKQTPIVFETGKNYAECFDQLSGLIGLTLCGELSLPFAISGPEAQNSISKFMARFPLTGSSKLKLVLEKNDLRGYHIKGVIRSDPKHMGFELLFDAEGSKNRRAEIHGDFINGDDEKTIKLSLDSPIKSIYGQASVLIKPSEYGLMLKIKNEAQEYYGRAGFNVQGNDRKSIYKPVIEYQLPDDQGKQVLKVDGQVIREVNGPKISYVLEGVKINVPKSSEPICVDGHFNQEPRILDLDLKAKQGPHTSVAIFFNRNGYEFKSEFQNTLNPYINFKLNGHIENGGSIYHNDLELLYSDFNNPQNKVVFGQLYKYYKKSPNEFSVITKNKIEILAVPIKLKFEAEVDPKKLELDLEGEYIDKKADFEVDARTQIKKPGDYSVKIKGEIDKHGMEAFAKRDIISAEKSNVENYVHFKNFGKYELSGVVLHKTKANDMNVGAVGHLKISGGGKNEDIKFDVGVIENNNLYSSHAKLSSNKGDILDYLLKVTRTANPNGQLKFILKDTVAANGQFKVNDNDGKGNGVIIVDFKKAGRKIKGDVKFVAKEPIFNADIDVFLNFEKDNNDKLRFSTNNKRTPKLLDSKNKLEYAGKKSEFNIHQDGSLAQSGKANGLVEVCLPSGRTITLKANRDMTVKDEVYDGNADVVLSDCPTRGGAGSTISYKTKLSNCNFDKNVIDMDSQFEFKLKDGGNVESSFVLKNIPKGDKSDFSFDGNVKGSLVPKPMSLVASMTYSELANSDDKYRMKASYGDDIFTEVVGTFVMHFPEKGEKKYLDDYTITFHLPLEKAHDIKYINTFLYLQPENKDVEITLIESLQINGDVYKLDANGKYGLNAGNTKVKVLVPHYDPLILDANYQANLEGDTKSGNVELKAQYGKGKTATVGARASVAPQHAEIKLSANAPQAEKFKRFEVDFSSKKPSQDTISAVLVVDADGRVYKSDSIIVYSKSNPLIDFKFTSPDSPKQSRVFFKGVTMSSTQAKLEMKIENIRDFNMDANAEGNFQKDNLAFKYQANSEKLGMKNYLVEISSKDANNGKRLEFTATNDNQNILSGSTSFISKQEGPKTIIEGSGSVTLKNEQKPANFKYIRTLLTEGNEQGVETFVNLAIGDRSYVVESRVTNLEYKNSVVFCEEKKQCAHADIISKINTQPGVVQHLVNMGLDLRKLGFAPEFGLQIKNEFSEKKFPQYDLNLHINKEDKKYHLHMYSQPDFGKFPAGITVTLPQRVLALESIVQYPTSKSLPFPIHGEISLYPDKNRPQQKTGARFNFDLSTSDNQGSAIAEFGFSHPKLGKEATLKLNGKLQRPDEKTLLIETTAIACHPSIGGDREQKFYLEVNPVHIKSYLVTPIVKVFDIEGKAVLKDNLQQGEVTFCLLEGKPVIFKAVAKDYKYYEFTTGYSDEKERKLSIIGRIEPEKRMDISMDIIFPGQKKNIAHGALYLDKDNFVKSDYGVSNDNFNYFVKALKNDVLALESRVKTLGDKASDEFKKVLKRVEPTLKQLEQAYEADFQKLVQDITNDQTLKEISESLKHIIQLVVKMVDDLNAALKPMIDKINQVIKDLSEKIAEMYEKQIEPQIKQLYTNISTMVKEYLDAVVDAATYYVALATDFFDKHKPEIQELTNTLTEIFKDLTRILVAQLKEWRVKVSAIMTDLGTQIKELPIVAFIKEKWQDLSIPQQLLTVVKEVYRMVRDILPTEELRNFAEALYKYTEKKLNQQQVDDMAELRVVYDKMMVAISSLVRLMSGQLKNLGVTNVPMVNSLPFIGPNGISYPTFGGSASLSFLNLLLRGDIPTPLDIIKAYRPRSLNPLDEIPSKLRAVVVNGQHIFTFDGRHLTFPGSCRYVLVHDHVDRNFTLISQLQNGQPKAIILEDKSGTTIELKENGQVALNGANHGFPVIEQDVFAFRQTNGRVGLGSSYGLMVYCTSKLEVCYIEVNGFYLGKIRGLLGDGNNEPFDDFRLPNGKISTSESEFGNAYRLASSCAQVKTPEHSHHQHHMQLPAACEAVFGGISPLRPLSLLLDVMPFRQACIHAVTGDDDAAYRQACDLGRGYAALALTGLLPAFLPERCIKCTDADSPKEIGEIYEIKLPNKQADIVVTVEITKSNEKHYKDIVVPLVGSLVDSLKSKRINDIKVYLVGVTSQYPYPIIYDTDLKLKQPKIQFTDESHYDFIKPIDLHQPALTKYEEIAVNIINELKLKLGLYNTFISFQSILDLPLRPGAMKHFVDVIEQKCEGHFFAVDIAMQLSYENLRTNEPFTQTLVTGSNSIKLGGAPAVVAHRNMEAKQGPVELPDDVCVETMYKLDSYVISGPVFCEQSPEKQKQVLQQTVNGITSAMLRETWVQQCTCVYVDPFRVRSVCINKERKIAGRRKK